MKIFDKYIGFKWGLLFFGMSIISVLTIIPPFLVMFFCAFIEKISEALLGNNSQVPEASCIICSILLLLSCLIFYFRVIKGQKSGRDLNIAYLVFYSLLFPVIHALSFYIYWGISYGFRGDGQLIFLIYFTMLFSGILFIPIGLINDLIYIKKINYTQK